VDLTGKVAVVTGSGRGLGLAYATELARRGAAVVVNDVDAEVADTAVLGITEAGGTAVAEVVPVGTSEAAQALVDRAVDEFGRLDVLVNNAGILRDTTLWKMTDEQFDAVINTHLRGTFTCTRAAAIRMREQGEGGRIICVGSPTGQVGNFGQTNYAAAKAGIVGMVRTWAMELARAQITVNAIVPVAATAMTETVPFVAPYIEMLKKGEPLPIVMVLGGDPLAFFYGGTEAQGATIISGVEWLAHRGSVGKIGDTSRLKILGEDGNEVATGETGEIYFLPNDGAGSTYHYLGAEPKRRPDGWESLGDIGRLDADGYLYLGDRLADMILRGGANIYPAEVEAAVTAHPDVRSCVVVGLPDPEFGQRVHAILELDPATDAQAVADGVGAFLADQLSRYKHPESFEIVHVGLRDDSGKVRRTLLRDERAGWMQENRDFRIMPARAWAKAE